MIEKSYENPVYQSGWYNPLLLDRWVPRCTRESILYQRDECLKCTRVDGTREMSEPRWTSERSSLDVNTVTTGTVFYTLILSTGTVFYTLYNV